MCRFKSRLYSCCKLLSLHGQGRPSRAARKPGYHNSLILQSRAAGRRTNLLLHHSWLFTPEDTLSTLLAHRIFQSHHSISNGPSILPMKQEGNFLYFLFAWEKLRRARPTRAQPKPVPNQHKLDKALQRQLLAQVLLCLAL